MIPFLALIPTPIKHALFASAVILSLSYWAYDHTWDKGYAAAVSEGLEATLAYVEASRVREQQMQVKVTEAIQNGKVREIKLKAAAVVLNNELSGLLFDLEEAARNLPGLTADAARLRAAAVGTILGECSKEITGLAAKADSHSSDTLMLIQAWPR